MCVLIVRGIIFLYWIFVLVILSIGPFVQNFENDRSVGKLNHISLSYMLTLFRQPLFNIHPPSIAKFCNVMLCLVSCVRIVFKKGCGLQLSIFSAATLTGKNTAVVETSEKACHEISQSIFVGFVCILKKEKRKKERRAFYLDDDDYCDANDSTNSIDGGKAFDSVYHDIEMTMMIIIMI